MIFWKNRGLMVIIYLGVSMIGSALVLGYLQRTFEEVFFWVDFISTIRIGFTVAAIWTFLVRDDYYKNERGERIKMDTVIEFYFIKLEYWAFIFAVLGFGLGFFFK